MTDDANTSSPQRLSREQRQEIDRTERTLPRSYDFNMLMDGIVLRFRVDVWLQRRRYQNEFYEAAKEIGRIRLVSNA